LRRAVARQQSHEIATPEPALSDMRFFTALRMTGSEGARNDMEVPLFY